MPEEDSAAASRRPGAALGSRLRSAREARSLTQGQAAAALGVSGSLLTAMEDGRDVAPDQLLALADLYGTKVSDLLRPGSPPAAIGTALRAAAAAAGSNAEAAPGIRQLEEHADNYLDLLRRAGAELPAPYPPAGPPARLDARAAEELATVERSRLGTGDGPLPGLGEVLEAEAGLRVFQVELPGRIAGLYAWADPLGGCVALNARHPVERQRWTLAHEYAHFLVSRDRAEVTPASHPHPVPEGEAFADAFAASFLIPRSGLSRWFSALTPSAYSGPVTPAALVQLARAYQVSVQALTRRLEDLRLVSPRTWEWLQQNSFRPRAATMPVGRDDTGPAAQSLPFHYRVLVTQLYAGGDITEGQLARYLGTDIAGARRAYQQLAVTGDVSADGAPQDW